MPEFCFFQIVPQPIICLCHKVMHNVIQWNKYYLSHEIEYAHESGQVQ